MKLLKLVGVLGLVALLIPLSGCIGDDEDAPAPKVSGGSEVAEGAPPAKFTFESVAGSATGEATRKYRERTTGDLPVLQGTAKEWKFYWNITGVQDLGTGDTGDAVGEVFYNVWIGEKTEDGPPEWQQVGQSQSVGKDGKISGESSWKRNHGGFVGVLLSLETKADSTVEIPLMQITTFEERAEETATLPFEDLETFEASFADAKVVNKDGKVNLTLTAFALPETQGSYDLFLRNDGGEHYLGSLKLDPTSGGYKLVLQPDAKLFTKYQFFISLEASKDKKDEMGGFKVLSSNFKS